MSFSRVVATGHQGPAQKKWLDKRLLFSFLGKDGYLSAVIGAIPFVGAGNARSHNRADEPHRRSPGVGFREGSIRQAARCLGKGLSYRRMMNKHLIILGISVLLLFLLVGSLQAGSIRVADGYAADTTDADSPADTT